MEKSELINEKHDGNAPLTESEVALVLEPLPFSSTLKLWLLGYAPIGKYKPKGFLEPMEFYVVKYKKRYFISYRQGWDQAFYFQEVAQRTS